MNMRETFVQTTNELIKRDPKVALVLGGISVASFADSIKKYPDRVFDAGIMEQAGVSIAAGMAITGMIPVYHTIAPFLVERAFEQLKIDFGYQELGGNFVSNGASLDYSSFGATHQCPADISLLKQIPGMQIVVAGTAHEFDQLYKANYNNGKATYYRLCRDENDFSCEVIIGKAAVIKSGLKATILAVGPMLKPVLEATAGLDVTVLYYSTVSPFDSKALATNCESGKLLICEPYYEGGVLLDAVKALNGKLHQVDTIGIPHEFCKHYGTTTQNMEYWHLTVRDIRNRIDRVVTGGIEDAKNI